MVLLFKGRTREAFLRKAAFFFQSNLIDTMIFVDSGSWLSWQSFFVLTETNYCFSSSNK